MDFEQVLKTLLDGFDRLRIRYAVCGGFALLVHRDDMKSLHEAKRCGGYGSDLTVLSDEARRQMKADAASAPSGRTLSAWPLCHGPILSDRSISTSCSTS